MELKGLFSVLFVVGCVSAQSYKVCIPTSNPVLCQSLDRDGSQAVCEPVESKIDCALKLARGSADFGVFSEEEIMLLAQQQTTSRVVASIRDVNRQEPYAFEAVAIVRSNHTGGLEGLRGGTYCHPGLDEPDLRWSPRVLRALEKAAANTDRCTDVDTKWMTAEELEVRALKDFFLDGCRPGPWSSKTSLNEELKSKYPSLCSRCGHGSSCNSYTINMGVSVAGVNNNNRHIQALQCLTTGGSVAYVAWQHVKEFFTFRNANQATSYALLCPDGQLQILTATVLSNSTAPCAYVRQPWSGIVASATNAPTIQAKLQEWWPQGVNPGNTWQGTLFNGIVGGANARVVFETVSPSVANYTSPIRNISSIEATASCLPAQRWCTISDSEQQKCTWIRSAAYTLGVEPMISCQQRTNTFDCFRDIRDNKADFMAADSNYGYLARQHYSLSPVKLVQNSRSNPLAFSRVAALVKAQTSVSRFENLKGKTACFPEFGGISYVAFVRAGQERRVLSSSQCDYQAVVSEFFGGACAPGALDASHSISNASDPNSNHLCTACKSSLPGTQGTCAFDHTNLYFGNNGSLACLADPNNDIAFVQMQNVQTQMQALNMNPLHYRVLCRNNTLAANAGVDVDENCLLAFVVDSEVLTRRNDPRTNALNALLDSLDLYFGYNADSAAQLVNLEIYSKFDSQSHLLFKNSAVGLSEPSTESSNEPSKNYFELFRHLEACTGAAPPLPGMASRSFYSVLTLVFMSLLTRYVIY